jgi:hypothetical protein
MAKEVGGEALFPHPSASVTMFVEVPPAEGSDACGVTPWMVPSAGQDSHARQPGIAPGKRAS